MLVSVFGLIGSGKSSVVQGLADKMGAVPVFEPLPNSGNFLLEKYYKDPAKYAFSMQMLLMGLRFQSIQYAQWLSKMGKTVVVDSSLFSDKAFLDVQRKRGLVTEDEEKVYNVWAEIMASFCVLPDLGLYLNLDIDTEIERIKARSRDCECNIERSYLEDLNAAYNVLMPRLSKRFPVAYIDAKKDKDGVLSDCMTEIYKRHGVLLHETISDITRPTSKDYEAMINKDDLTGLARRENLV